MTQRSHRDFDHTLRKALDHMLWADDQVWRGVRDLDPEPIRPALILLAHVLGAETIWLDRIAGTPQALPVWPEPEMDRLEPWRDAMGRRLAGVLKSDYPEREVAYSNSAGQEFATSVEDILLHVALHGAYHRGQISRCIREADFQPTPTDYIAYVRGVPAATQTPPR